MNNLEQLAGVLGTSTEALSGLDTKMAFISNKSGVLNDISLAGPSFTSEELIEIDKKLAADYGSQLDQAVLKVFKPQPGFFIKKEKIKEILAKQPPQSLLDHFGYKDIAELLDKEGFASVVASLRFTQTEEWMHQFFDVAYRDLKLEDFEDREVEIKTLDSKWLDIAQKFIGKKLHNVSHLKEYGVIFISPEEVNRPGETLRNFLLLLHYLHEVPFYSNLFRKFSSDPDFITKLQSLLRGDVPILSESLSSKTWMIVQRYLAKDNPNDSRLAAHHVNPEAEHWYLVGQDLLKVESELGLAGISKWIDSDWSDSNLVDLVMSLVANGEIRYNYHQREALWNRIFVGYFGRDKMNAMIEENIIKGFIEL
ncbi:MAG: hypothetical protein KBC81_03815 [Candidatus Pacebacteria bacterium]|nr:hypothetical protein [Candidatus Paceibacterota bacterium]